MRPVKPTEKGYYWLQDVDCNGRWMKPKLVWLGSAYQCKQTVTTMDGLMHKHDMREYEDFVLWSDRLEMPTVKIEGEAREGHIDKRYCTKCFTLEGYTDEDALFLPKGWIHTPRMRLCAACAKKYKRKNTL